MEMKCYREMSIHMMVDDPGVSFVVLLPCGYRLAGDEPVKLH